MTLVWRWTGSIDVAWRISGIFDVARAAPLHSALIFGISSALLRSRAAPTFAMPSGFVTKSFAPRESAAIVELAARAVSALNMSAGGGGGGGRAAGGGAGPAGAGRAAS